MRSYIPVLALAAIAPAWTLAAPASHDGDLWVQPQASLHVPNPHDMFRAALLTNDQSHSLKSAMSEWTEDGFDIDLKDKRLVQFAHDQEPVWISELDKIEARAKGIKFMDM